MKTQLYKSLLVIVFGISLLAFAPVSSADCRWVPGHYSGGLWVPGHRVCWGAGPVVVRPAMGCVWVSGHWAGGYWRPAHRVCR